MGADGETGDAVMMWRGDAAMPCGFVTESEFTRAVLSALRDLGGTASTLEIADRLAEEAGCPDSERLALNAEVMAVLVSLRN